MYDNISPNLNFVEQEKKIKQFWDDNKIFEKSIDTRKEGETFEFVSEFDEETDKQANPFAVLAKLKK